LLQVPVLIAVIAVRTRRGRILIGGGAAAAIVLRASGVLRAATFLGEPHLNALHRYKQLFGWGRFASTPAYFADFSWRLFESAYLAAGWQRFYANRAIVAMVLVSFVVLVSIGTWIGLRGSDLRIRIATLAAVAFAVVQLAAIYGTNYYLPGWGAQGRFLFPAIGPFAALCAVALVPSPTHATAARSARLATIGVLGAINLAAWLTAVVPVYARWI